MQKFLISSILPAFDLLSQSLLVKVLPRFSDLTSMVGQKTTGAFQDMTGYVTGSVMPSLQSLGDNILTNAIEPYLSLTSTLIDDVLNGMTPFVGYVLANTLPALAAIGVWINTEVLPPLGLMKTALLDSVDNALAPWVAELSGPVHTAMVGYRDAMLLYMLGPLALLALAVDGTGDPALDRLKAHILDVKDTLKDFSLTLQLQINTAAIPALQNFGDFLKGALLDAVGLFVLGAQHLFGDFFTNFLEGFAGDWQHATDPAADALKRLHDLVQPILDDIQRQWHDVTKSIGDALAKLGSVGDSFSSFWSALWFTLGIVVSTSVGTILAIVHGLVDGISNFIQGTVGIFNGITEAINGYVMGVVDTIQGFVTIIQDILTGSFTQLGDDIRTILGKLGDDMGIMFGGIGDAIGGIWQETVGTVMGIITGFVSGIMTSFNGLAESLSGGKGTIPELINTIVAWFGNLPGLILAPIGNFRDAAITGFDDVIDGILSVFLRLGADLVILFDDLWSLMKPGINTVIDGINEFIRAIDAIQLHIPSVNVGPLQTPAFNWNGVGLGQIPHLASGGDVSGLFVGAENGPELLMRPGLYHAPPGSHVANAGDTAALLGGSGGHSHDIYLDGYKVGKALAPHSVNVTRQASGIRA